MRGVAGLPEFLLPQVKSSGAKFNNQTSGDKVAFGNFFQRWITDGSGGNSKQVTGQKEENLLQKSLEKLINFSLLLAKGGQGFNPSETSLKDILNKIGADLEFFASLPEHLKELFGKLQNQNLKLSAKDIEAKEDLIKRWQKHQEEKQKDLLTEIQGLIAVIQEKLMLNAGDAKSQAELRAMRLQEIEALQLKTGFKESQQIAHDENISAVKAKIDQYTAQKGESLTVSQRLAMVGFPESRKEVTTTSLLGQISDFIKKAENTAERLGFKHSLSDLQQELHSYLDKGRQAQIYREELLGRSQYIALRETSIGQNDSQSSAFSNLTKENLTGDAESRLLSQGEKKEEGVFETKGANFDLMMAGDLQKDSSKIAHSTGERSQLFYQSQADQIFQQMVERFKLDIRQGVSQLEMRLYPEELGRLALKLTMEEGIVNARIVTETLQAKELIEQNLPQLRETMAKEGIRWDEVTVDVSHDGLSENPFAYQDGRQLQDNRHAYSDEAGDFEGELDELNLLEEETERVVRDPNRLIDYLV